LHICAVTEADIDEALALGWSDLEDACVYQCAQKINAHYIITRDKKGFAGSTIRVLDATGFFAHLKSEKSLSYQELLLSTKTPEQLLQASDEPVEQIWTTGFKP
jgi:hypothetical protein